MRYTYSRQEKKILSPTFQIGNSLIAHLFDFIYVIEYFVFIDLKDLFWIEYFVYTEAKYFIWISSDRFLKLYLSYTSCLVSLVCLLINMRVWTRKSSVLIILASIFILFIKKKRIKYLNIYNKKCEFQN